MAVDLAASGSSLYSPMALINRRLSKSSGTIPNLGHGGGDASFDKVDERGFMMVVATEYQGGGEPAPSDTSHESHLYWNGKKFTPRGIPAKGNTK